MAYIKLELRSEVLQARVNVNLFYPTDLPAEVGNAVKGVITLLHGYTNSAEDWVQMSSAARYAADNGLALVMPSCANSFYNDMVYGGAYFTFLTSELPLQLAKIFKLPTDREHNYIAGLSMGGYGALLLALRCPDKFCAVASFSGAVDVKYMIEKAGKEAASYVFAPVFGAELCVPDSSDIFALAREVAKLPAKERPRILCLTGSQDEEPYAITEQNHRLCALLKTLPLEFRYLEWDGVHEWNVWDRGLAHAIGFFLNTDYGKRKDKDWQYTIREEV